MIELYMSMLNNWDQILKDTVSKMLEFIKPFTTPISVVLSEEQGQHLGSGSYFENKGKKYIITNEHVAIDSDDYSLSHQFLNCDQIIKLTNPFSYQSKPIDAAVSRIDEKVWNSFKHDSSAIATINIAKTHSAVSEELFFIAGFSGERSSFSNGYLVNFGTPYLTQEKLNTSLEHPNFHFTLHYNQGLAQSIDNTSHLPMAPGISGSLVWDTKRIACLNGNRVWKAHMAKVTGIVWGWSSTDKSIIATKVEHLNLKNQ